MSLILIIIAAICALDLLVFFIMSVKNLPTGFTEWLCYPFYPLVHDGFPMFVAMFIRLVEIILVIIGAGAVGNLIS